ncbi:hypothetical protein MRS44_016479 [Fusarium solani]|uniref:uncharacterized protein n=1 Tax=Fusarium solani TaxID=169388 RepID=UPI0032C470D6|nr:hypothetical protein MRS44_016479 [Fusarium solani]
MWTIVRGQVVMPLSNLIIKLCPSVGVESTECSSQYLAAEKNSTASNSLISWILKRLGLLIAAEVDPHWLRFNQRHMQVLPKDDPACGLSESTASCKVGYVIQQSRAPSEKILIYGRFGITSNIQFVDQTLDTVRSVDIDSNVETYEDDADGQDSPTALESEHAGAHAHPQSPLTTDMANTQSDQLTYTTLPLHRSPHGLCQPPSQVAIDSSVGYAWVDGHLPHLDDLVTLHHKACPEASHAHATERKRAELFRYFIFNLSPAFDFGDPDKAFSKGLAQHALADHNLVDLIALVSARHLGSNTSFMGHGFGLDRPPRSARDRETAHSMHERDQLDAALLHRFGQTMEGKLCLFHHMRSDPD